MVSSEKRRAKKGARTTESDLEMKTKNVIVKELEEHPEFIRTHEDMQCVFDMSTLDGYCHLCGAEHIDFFEMADHFANEHDFFGGV